MSSTSNTDRLAELLTEQLDRDLSDAEQQELDRLLDAHPDWREDDLELAAAAAFLAFEPQSPPMPEALSSKIMASVMSDGASRQDDAQSASAQPISLDAERERRGQPSALLTYSGWIAAAACLLIALMLWRQRPAEIIPQPIPPPTVVPPKVKTVAELRQSLQKKPGVLQLAWSGTEDPLAKNAGGDVIWDPASQKGYMRFSGLPVNDPKKNQYQLWIFDAKRDAKHPVDGGVFDIDENGEVIVPINAKLNVNEATLFAVTWEQPGGVVVSKREHIVVLAKVEG